MPKSVSVLQLSFTGRETIAEWASIAEAVESLRKKGYPAYQSGISACCNGRRKTHCGFQWEYKQ